MPLNQPMADTSQGAPSQFDLAKEEFLTRLQTSFDKTAAPWAMAAQKTVGKPGQKMETFTRMADLTVSKKTPGEEVPTQKTDQRPIHAILEDEEDSSAVKTDRVDSVTTHLDFDPKVAEKSGNALLAHASKHAMQVLAICAKMAPETLTNGGVIPGGNKVNRVVGGASTIQDVYPMSEAGSHALQADLAAISIQKRNKRVPKSANDWYVWLTPYLSTVLRQDKTLLSRDYDGTEFNSLIGAEMKKVEGFWVMELPDDEWLPNENLSTSTDTTKCPLILGSNSYRGDFRNISFLTQTPESICAVKADQFIIPDIHDLSEKHAKIVGASMLKGLSGFMPECCGIGTWSTS